MKNAPQSNMLGRQFFTTTAPWIWIALSLSSLLKKENKHARWYYAPLKFDHTRRQVGDGHCYETAGAASKIC